MYTTEEIEHWLEENLPHIKLVEYGGKVKAISTFYNTENDSYFHNSVNNIKSDVRRGRNVGLTPVERKRKKQETWKKRYGVDHPKKSQVVQDKYVQTCLQRYGTKNYFSSDEWKKKAKFVYKKNLGVDNPAKDQNVLEKMKNTNLERYGSKTYAEATATDYNGYTITDLKEKTGLSRSWVYKQLHIGVNPEELGRQEKSTTEFVMKNILDDLNQVYIQDRKIEGLSIRPDFYLPDYDMVIECDGLYWHSDAIIKDRYHHKKRRAQYLERGLTPLFFREDELFHKPEIVKSIVANKLYKTKRIYARNTYISSCKSNFFEDNHLMGSGSGRIYSLMLYDEPVSAIQIKGVDNVEISRFCHKLNHTVVGGFSKLLKYVIQEEDPKSILTYIDLRYGSGQYLSNFGFTHISSNVSFRWTTSLNTFHRMKFKSNQGYEKGHNKIWDCGQAKWIKYV